MVTHETATIKAFVRNVDDLYKNFEKERKMTVKEIIELANLQKEVASATSHESVVSIAPWGVQMTAKGMIDTFSECDREDDDRDRYYLVAEVNGVRFFALTDDEEMEELEAEREETK